MRADEASGSGAPPEGAATGGDPETVAIVLERAPSEPRQRSRATLLVARACGVTVAEAAPVLERLPFELPRRFARGEAEALARDLTSAEVAAQLRPGPSPSDERCPEHPGLLAGGRCPRCDAYRCSVCAAASPRGLCPPCARRARRSRGWFAARVAALLGVLAIVLLWAGADIARRRDRNRWQRPVTVAVVVLRHGDVDEDAIEALRERTPALAARLAAESGRYRSLGFAPFSIELLGPIDALRPPPQPAGDGVVALGRYSLDLWRYRRTVDARVGLHAAAYDCVIYATVRPPRSERQASVEGLGQEGGRFGSVEVELTREMADFALVVVTHELFHTLGATDKYDEAGRTRLPEGLCEPDAVPLLPQPCAEVMARQRVLSAQEERLPESIDELGVGPITAREIGWTQ